SLDEFRGLYVSDQQVDTLLRDHQQSTAVIDPTELTHRAVELHQAGRHALGDDSPWVVVRNAFELSEMEVDVLLLGLALETHPKYETLFAYLNNDVTRKWPTFDLALRLLADEFEQKMELRRSLLPHSRLFSSGLLRLKPLPNDRAAALS